MPGREKVYAWGGKKPGVREFDEASLVGSLIDGLKIYGIQADVL